MVDNTAQNATNLVATDKIDGKHHQRIKLEHGPDGSIDGGDISVDNPLPTRTAILLSDLYEGLSLVVPKFLPINVSGAGDLEIVAAVIGKKIQLLQLLVMGDANGTIRLEDGAGGAALTGLQPIQVGRGFVLPFSPIGWGKTSVNTALSMEIVGLINVDGIIGYAEVDA